MKNTFGVVLKIIKIKKYWDLMYYCVLMHRRIPLFLHDNMDAYVNR